MEQVERLQTAVSVLTGGGGVSPVVLLYTGVEVAQVNYLQYLSLSLLILVGSGASQHAVYLVPFNVSFWHFKRLITWP